MTTAKWWIITTGKDLKDKRWNVNKRSSLKFIHIEHIRVYLSWLHDKGSMVVRCRQLDDTRERRNIDAAKCHTLCCILTMTEHTTQTWSTRVNRRIMNQKRMISSSGYLHLHKMRIFRANLAQPYICRILITTILESNHIKMLLSSFNKAWTLSFFTHSENMNDFFFLAGLGSKHAFLVKIYRLPQEIRNPNCIFLSGKMTSSLHCIPIDFPFHHVKILNLFLSLHQIISASSAPAWRWKSMKVEKPKT